MVGTDIYEILIKDYTEKQLRRSCSELPAFIIKRLLVRFTYDNNYFNALYQGIQVGGEGCAQMIASMLENTELQMGVDYLTHKTEMDLVQSRDREMSLIMR